MYFYLKNKSSRKIIRIKIMVIYIIIMQRLRGVAPFMRVPFYGVTDKSPAATFCKNQFTPAVKQSYVEMVIDFYLNISS